VSTILLALVAFQVPAAQAKLEVLACEPEWGALVTELAGDLAKVNVASTAFQDPHRVEARPSLIARARRADLLVCTGAELEIGWLPLLQRESGNARIQVGQPGFFEAARHVPLIERPAVLDRSMGDVHAAGNPHIHLDPRNIPRIADALTKRLGEIDPANAARYAERNADFKARWTEAVSRWERQGTPLKGVRVAVHHKNWSYLLSWLGMEAVVDLEPKPGVDPSAAYLSRVVRRLKQVPVKMVLRANYQSPRPAEWVSKRTRVPALDLPFTVGASKKAKDLFGLYDDLLGRITGALR
jgi:zinc/manganese transport system substrate-binding protein